MKHLIMRDPDLNGWEYGMLRSFETAVIEETKASMSEIPRYDFGSRYLHHFGQGMKRASYRNYFPKQTFTVLADVGWYILMGPENYKLDLYKGWDTACKTKILYLFDTLPAQYPLIKKLLGNHVWDILITSFNDAVEDLEKITGRKWHCVEQAADKNLFRPVPVTERNIHFSAYGRRYPQLHEIVKEFCAVKGLYYDYTTHDGKHPVVDSTELYRQYAWHLSHSHFTFSWPVELTNPTRVGHLHPITCRWFEAAAAGTAIIGRQPNNLVFGQWLDPDMVIDMDPADKKEKLWERLEEVWENRENELKRMTELSEEKSSDWSWNERVNRIKSLL